MFFFFFFNLFYIKISPLFSFCSVSRGLHPQCKLDLESAAPAGESEPRLSFPFPPQPRDLYARRAAAGCGARGCAVILPKVKLPPFLLDRSSVALPSPPGRKRRRGDDRAEGTHAGKQDVESLLSGAKRRNGRWHSGSVSVLVRGRREPWGDMAAGQEVGRGLSNYVYNILTLYGFTLGWFFWGGGRGVAAVLSGYH